MTWQGGLRVELGMKPGSPYMPIIHTYLGLLWYHGRRFTFQATGQKWDIANTSLQRWQGILYCPPGGTSKHPRPGNSRQPKPKHWGTLCVCLMQGHFREGHSWLMLSWKTYYIGFLCRVLSKKQYHSCLPFSSVFGRTGGAMTHLYLVAPNMFYDRTDTFWNPTSFEKRVFSSTATSCRNVYQPVYFTGYGQSYQFYYFYGEKSPEK